MVPERIRPVINILILALLSIAVLAPSGPALAESNDDYHLVPPFLGRTTKPAVLVIMDNSGSMEELAYQEDSGDTGRRTLTSPADCNAGTAECYDNFDPSFEYSGIFEPNRVYKYDSTNLYFYTDPSWSTYSYTLTGTHTGGDDSTTQLVDAAAAFLSGAVPLGRTAGGTYTSPYIVTITVENTTDGSTWRVTDVDDDNTLSLDLIGAGEDSDWDAGDSYEIVFRHAVTKSDGTRDDALNPGDLWSGAYLNWIAMRRIDVVKKVLIGGKAAPGVDDVLVSPTSERGVIRTVYGDSSPPYYTPFQVGLYHYRYNGSHDYGGGSCSTTYISAIEWGDHMAPGVSPSGRHHYCVDSALTNGEFYLSVKLASANERRGIIQNLGDAIRFGYMNFNYDQGGEVRNRVGDNISSIVDNINSDPPQTWTPLSETLYEAVRYFRTDSPYFYSSDFTSGATDPDWDPWRIGGELVDCAKAFVIFLTDGEATHDSSVPADFAGTGSKDYDGDGKAADTWYDGSDALDDVALWMNTQDMRPTDMPDTENTISLYTIYAFGDGAARNLLKDAAMNGGFIDRSTGSRSGLPDGGPAFDYTQTPSDDAAAEWWTKQRRDINNEVMPDNYFEPQSFEQLERDITAAMLDILRRASSGTAASILSGSRSGEGALYQAMFFPLRQTIVGSDFYQLDWSGTLRAYWVDENGNLRENTSDGSSYPTLEENDDRIIKFFFDNQEQRTRIRRYPVTEWGKVVAGAHDGSDGAAVLYDESADFIHDGVEIDYYVHNLTQGWQALISGVAKDELATQGSNTWDNGDDYIISEDVPVEVEIDEVESVWDAGQYLAKDMNASDRRIWTYIPGDAAMQGGGASLDNFTTTNAANLMPYLGIADTDYYAWDSGLGADEATRAQNLITWIRGNDVTDLRPRQWPIGSVAYTWKLGDIIHSTPTLVGVPAEDYDFIYSDISYADFYKYHASNPTTMRRQVLYAGGNDGMLHAFNAGWYNRDEKRFEPGPDGDTTFDLGEEMWAFMPYQVLPLLKFLTSDDYQHVFMVDMKTKVVDVRLQGYAWPGGTANAHVNDWATLLICGMRFGGLQKYGRALTLSKDFDGDLDNEFQPFASAYYCLDITIPENPRLMWYFEDMEVIKAVHNGGDNQTVFSTAQVDVYRWPDETTSVHTGKFTDPETGVKTGMYISNVTKGTRGVIDSIADYSITADQEDGSDFDWDDGDEAMIAVPRMGFTTCYPGVARIKDYWYAVLGSGPTAFDGHSEQKARVYLVNLDPTVNGAAANSGLATAELVGGGTEPFFELPDENSAVADPSVVDLDIGKEYGSGYGVYYTADLIYVGTSQNPLDEKGSHDGADDAANLSDSTADFNAAGVQTGMVVSNLTDGSQSRVNSVTATSLGTSLTRGLENDWDGGDEYYVWAGKLYRIVTNNPTADGESYLSNTNCQLRLLYDPEQPVSSPVNVALDEKANLWVYFGTGRYLSDTLDNDSALRTFFGIMEPDTLDNTTGLLKDEDGDGIPEGDRKPDVLMGTGVFTASGAIFDATDSAVTTAGYVCTDYPTCSSVVPFSTLEDDIQTNKLGWMLDLDEGERVLGQPAVFGGLVLFTAYIPPSGTGCNYEGESYLYAPYYKTGTAYTQSIIGLEGELTLSGKTGQIVSRRLSLGKGLATTPTIHQSHRSSKVFIQTSTGAIVDLEFETKYPTKSGLTSWRDVTP